MCVCAAAGKQSRESRPREEEPVGDKKNEPYVFKFEKRFDFKDFDPRNWGNWLPLALALAAGYMLTHSSGQPRQISWQEFRINYLERGEVERLEVVNRSLVRAYLRRDSAGQVTSEIHVCIHPLVAPFEHLVNTCMYNNGLRYNSYFCAEPLNPNIQHWQC